MLGRIHPFAMEKDDRAKAYERLERAYCIQQPWPVPDQACIVWRADLMEMRYDLIHKQASFDFNRAKRENGQPTALTVPAAGACQPLADERAAFEAWLRRRWPNACRPIDEKTVTGSYAFTENNLLWEVWQVRAALAQQAGARAQPELTVWYGAMPESNGKSNFTAILRRKGAGPFDTCHVTIDRSEYPDRVRYEADRVRWIIGELDAAPCILDYDADKHSGYVAAPAPATEEERDAKDAARWRWFAKHGFFWRGSHCLQTCWPRHGEIGVKDPDAENSKEAAINAEIDAAIQSKTQEAS
jgi:hypothetical protein